MDSESNTETKQETNFGSGRILGLLPIFLIFLVIILRVTWVIYKSFTGQKTRSTQQQRRVYVGSRQRQLSVQGEPTIFVSPANLPPPPKYEAMAPPSYDEVMSIQYPGYQPGQQPIAQPLVHALAHSSSNSSEVAPTNVTVNVTNNRRDAATVGVDAPAVFTVTTEERRTSVAVRA